MCLDIQKVKGQLTDGMHHRLLFEILNIFYSLHLKPLSVSSMATTVSTSTKERRIEMFYARQKDQLITGAIQ